MTRTLIFASAFLALAGTSGAYAGNDAACGNAPRASWMTNAAAAAKLSQKGYDVRRVKAEDNCLEAYAIDGQGRRVEVHLHPVTGAIVRVKDKS